MPNYVLQRTPGTFLVSSGLRGPAPLNTALALHVRTERSRHVDASEPDSSGIYEYHYEYDLYRFTDGSECLLARSYTDTPSEVHFLAFELHGERRALKSADLSKPLLRSAVELLRSEGKLEFNWLGGEAGTYQPLSGPQV